MSPRVRPVSLALVAALALSLGAAACGGDDRLSREEYIAQADAICERVERQLQGLGQAESVEQFARLAERAIPIVRKSFDDIEALEPPEELEAKVHEWHEVNREGLRALEDLPAAARARNRSETEQILRKADETEQRADRLGREIGLKKCAESG